MAKKSKFGARDQYAKVPPKKNRKEPFSKSGKAQPEDLSPIRKRKHMED